jgi:hypothetical protein
VIAAIEDSRYSDRHAIHNLRDAAKLLQPHLEALNTAFSERDFPKIKQAALVAQNLAFVLEFTYG